VLNRYINIAIWIGTFLGSGFTAFQLIVKSRSYRNYSILFEEPLGGLYVGSEVFLNGIRVGTVQSLDMWHDDLDKSVVIVKTRNLKQEPYIRAEVAMRGFTGHSCINMNYVKDPAELDPINGIQQIKANQSFMNRIKTRVEVLANDNRLDTLLQTLIQSMDTAKTSVDDLRGIFSKTQTLLDKLNATAATAPESMTQLNQALNTTNKFITKLDSLLADSHLSVLLNQDLKSITYSQSDLRKIVRDLRDVIHSIKQRPMQFLSKGVKSTDE